MPAREILDPQGTVAQRHDLPRIGKRGLRGRSVVSCESYGGRGSRRSRHGSENAFAVHPADAIVAVQDEQLSRGVESDVDDTSEAHLCRRAGLAIESGPA